MFDVVAAGIVFVCTPVAVWDGDGPIWCEEGPKIRLSGIAAREIDETCKVGHPCPSASGVAARNYLVGLLGGPKGTLKTGHIRVRGPVMRCTSYGGGKGTRTAALCSVAGRDLSCEMVRAKVAVRWSKYGGDRLCR